MSGHRSTFLKTMAASVAAVSMLSCSGGGESVTVNERMLLCAGDTLVPNGGGCMWMKLPSSGGSSSGGGNGDISLIEGTDGNAFTVRVFSDQELLASRSYTVEMLRSGRLDEFSVTTHSDAGYLFRYWGGSCTELDASSP